MKDLYTRYNLTSLYAHMFLWVMTSYNPIGCKQTCGGNRSFLEDGKFLFFKILHPSKTPYYSCICSLFNDTLPCVIFLNLQHVAAQPSVHAFFLLNISPFIHFLNLPIFSPRSNTLITGNIYIFLRIFL